MEREKERGGKENSEEILWKESGKMSRRVKKLNYGEDWKKRNNETRKERREEQWKKATRKKERERGN